MLNLKTKLGRELVKSCWKTETLKGHNSGLKTPNKAFLFFKLYKIELSTTLSSTANARKIIKLPKTSIEIWLQPKTAHSSDFEQPYLGIEYSKLSVSFFDFA